MALVTNQVQGSYKTFPRRTICCNRAIRSKQFGLTLPVDEKTNRSISLEQKCNSCLRVRAPLFLGPKGKLLKISSFKGIGQNEETNHRAVGSKSLKNSVKLSYVPQDSEEKLTESPKVQDVSSSSTSLVFETTERSQAIHSLFLKWLNLLRNPSPNEVVQEALEGVPTETSETPNGMQKSERGKILRDAWGSFADLDEMIKIPLISFIPLYLAVNVVYGAEVVKELTPLWVLGPLLIAIYIKMFRAICALYAFSYKQTVEVIKKLPAYHRQVCNYIFNEKLKECWLSLENIKNLNYKDLSKRKIKEFYGWLVERYLDYIESIWPSYCRTIRFLKRANLI